VVLLMNALEVRCGMKAQQFILEIDYSECTRSSIGPALRN